MCRMLRRDGGKRLYVDDHQMVVGTCHVDVIDAYLLPGF